jgi:hypothetical protein
MRDRTRREVSKQRFNRVAAALVALALAGSATALAQTQITPPQPTVPEVFTLEGEFVRVAYNNEGYATLGYRMAQEKVGEEWMLLQFGVTLRKPAPDYRLKREHLWITTPDGKKIPLATQQEYMAVAGPLAGLNRRARMVADSIGYFPTDATQACALRFFSDTSSPGPAFDEIDLGWQRACVGRLYFKVPGGIQIGQHWLHVQLAGSSLQVPFRIMTDDEEKMLRKRWEELKKELDATFQQ